VTASGPTAFYMLELARVLVPVTGISLILAAVIRSHGQGNSLARRWLIVITSAWLFVTLVNRLLLSAPVRNHFIPAAIHDYESAHRQSLYFATGPFLWLAEEILLSAFGILLFFAVRSNRQRDIGDQRKPCDG
jgi:hypothetical protein